MNLKQLKKKPEPQELPKESNSQQSGDSRSIFKKRTRWELPKRNITWTDLWKLEPFCVFPAESCLQHPSNPSKPAQAG